MSTVTVPCTYRVFQKKGYETLIALMFRTPFYWNTLYMPCHNKNSMLITMHTCYAPSGIRTLVSGFSSQRANRFVRERYRLVRLITDIAICTTDTIAYLCSYHINYNPRELEENIINTCIVRGPYNVNISNIEQRLLAT